MPYSLLWLLFLALAPVSLIFTYIYVHDRHEREPLKYLIITFIWGILIAVPVVLLGGWLSAWLGVSDEGGSYLSIALYAFGVVGLSEEGMKFAVLRLYNYPKREFDEPYDGIMYGAAVSLGFAAIENVLYVMTSEDAMQTALMRMFTAVPAHASFGVVMGYFAGRAKFSANSSAGLLLLRGLAAAILLHGLYDLFLFIGEALLALFSFAVLALGIGLSRRAMRLHALNSPHRHDLG
jgi:RsiW-degrading membrane proteinase PrsW (M82 family)